MTQFFKPFVAAFLMSCVLTPLAIVAAKKLGFLDIPKDNRRMHKKPMPIAGGVAMYLSVVMGIVYFLHINRMTISLLVGATIILISGLIDDRKGLSPKMKIFFQLAAGLSLIAGNVKIAFFTNPFFSVENPIMLLTILSVPITLFWICGITNTINLIDGLDGLAAGVSMICAISMLVIAHRYNNNHVAVIAALTAGSCLGFLPYNFNPAKIFMGDTGALFLGFMLSFISIEGVMKSAALLMVVVPVLVLGVPVFDTAFAMLRRKLSGKSMVEADKGHLHHRLLARGLNQKQTVLILYAISAIFGVLANVIADLKSSVGLILSALIVIIILLMGLATGMLSSKEV